MEAVHIIFSLFPFIEAPFLYDSRLSAIFF